MAIIGTFTKLNEGAYVGAIKTVALNVKVRFQKVATESDKGPDFRIYAGDIEFGAAWTRTSREEREYLSVKLEDPSFVTPIYATLVAGEGCHNLVWSRSRSVD